MRGILEAVEHLLHLHHVSLLAPEESLFNDVHGAVFQCLKFFVVYESRFFLFL